METTKHDDGVFDEDALAVEQSISYAQDLVKLYEKERKVRRELEEANKKLEREIAERRHAEVALRESERRFRAVFEISEDGIFVKDADLRYTHVNQALLNALELDSSSILGKTDHELFDSDYASRMKEVELRVMNGRTIETEQALNWKAWRLILSTVRIPMYDPSGATSGICGFSRIVSEPRREMRSVAGADAYPSRVMQDCLADIRHAAENDCTILLIGESGSGKDYLARYLHDHSRRAAGPFFTFNCAALAPELVESELFGHEAGAFTGSRGRKRGLLELAEGGTLVLNEIGEMPLQLQSKLLTFLDTQTYTRVGGGKNITVNARIVAATNRDLIKEIGNGGFRQDLFYRLNVKAIETPPLRRRVEDLPQLVPELLQSLVEKIGLHSIPEVTDKALQVLSEYTWPGNVRELRNVLERALILCDRKRITSRDLGLAHDKKRADEDLWFGVRLPKGGSMHDALREAKKEMLSEALRRSGGSIKEAASFLGMTRDSFNHHMRSLGLCK